MIVKYLFPSNPLIQALDIQKALKLLRKKADIVISVSETKKCSFTSNKLNKNKSLKNFYKRI